MNDMSREQEVAQGFLDQIIEKLKSKGAKLKDARTIDCFDDPQLYKEGLAGFYGWIVIGPESKAWRDSAHVQSTTKIAACMDWKIEEGIEVQDVIDIIKNRTQLPSKFKG